MAGLPLTFANPAVLFGLLALPVIWWLLRLTPPHPREEVFPPLRILARVLKSEETPQQSPWWLTLLRLLMAALVIVALAGPIFKPREAVVLGDAPLVLVIDNGWASAPDWERRRETAATLIGDAGEAGVPVVLALTAEKPNAEIGPFDAATARDRLAAAEPRPVSVDRVTALSRIAETLDDQTGVTLALLTDGLASEGDARAFAQLQGLTPEKIIWADARSGGLTGLVNTENGATALTTTVIRPADEAGPALVTLHALDDKGRRIGEAQAAFRPGDTKASAAFQAPFELRNDFAAIVVDGARQAAATRVLDDNSRRRRIALISASEADNAQPLLSPLYYIRRALKPFADLVEPQTNDLNEAIPEILDQKPAVIVMADIGVIPNEARQALTRWVEGGGTLVRFAGPRLAGTPEADDLLPVRLRSGERALGGTLSWTEPQPVAEFPANGGFAGLTPPRDVTVSRQVLAEPEPGIVERTWAALADGTPLVTGGPRGDGTIVLFHVTPEASWSTLPISGTFVEMLRRIVQFSRNQGAIAVASGGQVAATLPPWRMIAADGSLAPPPPDARPLDLSAGVQPVSLEHPPGLYGSEDGVVARNLLPADATLEPLARPPFAAPVTAIGYGADESASLKGPLLAAAAGLLALDTLIVFWLSGLMARRPRRAATAALVLALAGAMAMPAFVPRAQAQETNDQRPGDAEAIAAIERTRLAYVRTGNGSIDAISRAGLHGLTQFLIRKTALEPGDPVGVDIATDELAFYPIIYWPVDAAVPVPPADALARIDAYMQQGGTVLFDTRDAYSAGFGSTAASPATQRLREILSSMNVPALEPVPPDHVLTKSFYILSGFPGRFSASPLWVEASLEADSQDNRPVRTGDGVSPILITGNDFAGAWAIDANGDFLLPTVPNNPLQRVYAYRAGVNIMMYMLTGNYKADQVHIPALLERLGQ
ncbi:RNA-binding protein [Zhengella mangrovi]|uniref:RNA-binding protein n=1 Tax=Zhengella mangrovi TaxID=1982044 RepID=A0A2G1QPE9_9HYPH|nr:DUF4159 domain-containing protein [Zhengella mangrovi]PHP67427.1 RNA-binding protein [Zhengella mangrovi]